MTDTDFQGGCKWMTTYEHSLATASERRFEREFVTCCNCANKVAYVDSWVTVPYGMHGNLLPLPVFIHCHTCSLILDPKLAYQEAFRKDRKASLPDPEKVKRQTELEVDLLGDEERPEHRHDNL